MTNNVPEVLANVRNYAALNKVPVISREAEDILTCLIKRHQPENILEIGTAIGYSSMVMASCLPSDSKIVTIEKNPDRIKKAREFFAAYQAAEAQLNVQIIEGDAGEIIPRLKCFFDLVFIDAAKGQYLDYLSKILPKLNSNAVVVADNVLFRGWTLLKDDAALNVPRRFRTIVRRLKAYLDFVSSDARFNTVIHEIGDGIAVSYYNEFKEVD